MKMMKKAWDSFCFKNYLDPVEGDYPEEVKTAFEEGYKAALSQFKSHYLAYWGSLKTWKPFMEKIKGVKK